MTKPVELTELLDARQTLVDDLQSRLKGPIAEFLHSLQAGDPDFDILGYPQAAELPAIRWKLRNLTKLIETNPAKHAERSDQLHRLLG